MLTLAACTTVGGEQFEHVAAPASLTAQPHSAAEIERFETLHVPGATDGMRSGWRGQFLDQRLNRAFAVSAHNSGSAFGWSSADDAMRTAVANCQARAAPAGETCTPYAVNTQIMYPGQEYTLPFRGQRLGPFNPSPEFVYHGPGQAHGLLIWSHGTYAAGGYACGDNGAKYAPWAAITLFNRAGWDIVRFDRDPCQDDLAAALRQIPGGVAAAKAAGYRRIVLAGQSRGAVHSLMSLTNPEVKDAVTGVIAFSPANSGKDVFSITVGEKRWNGLVDGLSGTTPVAVFFFDKDEFNPLAKQQTEYARQNWRERMPNAHIYFNDDPRMVIASNGQPNGHGGAGRPAFTQKYGACLIQMMEQGAACPE